MNNHLDPEEMLTLLDGERAAGEQHVLACEACRGDVEALRDGVGDYVAWHRHIVVPLAPPPPAKWKDLSDGMDAVDRRLAARPSFRASRAATRPDATVKRPRLWWGLAAAAAALLLLLYAGYRRIPSVQAAELLEKAVKSAPPVHPDTPIRFHTRSRDFVRRAVLLRTAPAQGGELAQLFAAAQFDWEQPFSARAFAEWRRRLTDNRDEVEYRSAVCRITTSSASNPLARATLVLRSSDLAPVSETLEFRESETIEISAVSAPADRPEGVVPPPSAPAPRSGVAPALAPTLPRAAVTLHVLAALHAIGADLGELELRDEAHGLLVEGPGLSVARRDEIRRAVAGIEGVEVDFAADSGAPARAPSARQQNQKPAGPAPLRTLLESKIPESESVEDVVNRTLDTSDSVMARAFALRTLARRYPPEDEQALAPSDRDLLARLRDDHTREMNARFHQLAGLLSPLLSPTPAPPATTSTWQRAAEQSFASVQALDSLLSSTLAGAPRGSPSQAELLQQLEDAVRRAQSAMRAMP
ncbi:MAG TPA: hypothetical protein VGZ73_24820 [Bryobacteraceae bacterium]|nr:hypothetical protein [Bryobacteraceae bacterium]